MTDIENIPWCSKHGYMTQGAEGWYCETCKTNAARKTETPKVGDICASLSSRIVIRVIEIKSPPNMLTDELIGLCEILYVPERLKDEYEGMPNGYFHLAEFMTIADLMSSWSDFMTLAAWLKNVAPKDEPVHNKGLVWRFWQLGSQAYGHLVRWDVKQQL